MSEPKSEIQVPLTLVIQFGLLFSTVLNMVVVRVAYFPAGGARGDTRERSAAQEILRYKSYNSPLGNRCSRLQKVVDEWSPTLGL